MNSDSIISEPRARSSPGHSRNVSQMEDVFSPELSPGSLVVVDEVRVNSIPTAYRIVVNHLTRIQVSLDKSDDSVAKNVSDLSKSDLNEGRKNKIRKKK